MQTEASTQDLVGYGPRSVAMGSLGASFLDDYAAVHSNPAALSRATRRSVSLGYGGVFYALSVQRSYDPAQRVTAPPAPGALAALTLPLPFPGVLQGRTALGIAFHLPPEVTSEQQVFLPEQPRFPVAVPRARSVAILAGVGVALPAGFRVGAGISALATLAGAVTLSLDSTGALSWRVDDRLTINYAPVVGVSWERSWFRSAVTFRGVLPAGVSLSVRARDLGIALPAIDVSGFDQYDPWQVHAEVALVHRGWTAALGAVFKRWSEHPGFARATTPRSVAPPAPGFADTVVPRLGVEHRWSSALGAFSLRGGYFFEPTPLPPATGLANYLDNDRHAITTGFALEARSLGTILTLELSGQVHALVPREVTKDASVSASNPGAPTLRHGGVLGWFGAALTVSL